MPTPTPPALSPDLAPKHRKPASHSSAAVDALGQTAMAPGAQLSQRSAGSAQDVVEIASEHSFPASDPPAWIWRAHGI